ncbi:MAG: ribonuclease III, partial [Planctomycetota bacterium]|nr:ribonuclease III [Planctomycetota bacterium]
MTEEEAEKIGLAIGYRFRDVAILSLALTHSSSVTEPGADNERLEFLGDAVVGLAVGEELYRRFPDWDEGELTQVKSEVVSTARLAERAKALGIKDHMRLGKGFRAGEEIPASVYANMFESIAGGIYLDGGLEEARKFVLSSLMPVIEEESRRAGALNYKARLQRKAQKICGAAPRYMVVGQRGPDHEKIFEVRACVGGRTFPPANGRTKKEAEQAAAAAALAAMEAEAGFVGCGDAGAPGG